MKPTMLHAYGKGRKIIDSVTINSFNTAQKYVSLFGRMFVHNNENVKETRKAMFYRDDLLYRLNEKIKILKENNENQSINE